VRIVIVSPVNNDNRGLEGVVAAVSSVSSIVGDTLTYRGFNVEELARYSRHQEVTYLLWYGDLPTRPELDRFDQKLRNGRELPAHVAAMIKGLPGAADPMDILRTAVSAMCLCEHHAADTSRDANADKAARLVACLPTAIAGIYRTRTGQEWIPPNPELSAPSDFLWMVFGASPFEFQARALEIALIVHADHELNASTFAARVAASTLADLHSAVVAALATLAGPLHGGAATAVMEMLGTIEVERNVDAYLDDSLRRRARIAGFGHRVYAGGDPRARVLQALSAELAVETGNGRWYELSRAVQEAMGRKTGLFPNVDFYAASVYTYLGLPTYLFAPLFAWARTSGWIAHILEQYGNNRLIRPRADYVGAGPRSYTPIHER
jgi:citrate synthase